MCAGKVLRLDGRVALITGGASGLGRAFAERLARDGALVAISDIRADVGAATATDLGVLFFEHDVADESQWEQVVAQIEKQLGRLNILVNNAGTLGPRDAVDPETTRLCDWKKVLSVNLDSVFLGCKVAIPAMRRAGGGSIVNVSPVTAVRASPHATAYGASKAGVRQLTKSVAQYCAERKLNIRCNSLHPGDVITPLWQAHAQEAAKLRQVPVQQILDEARVKIPLGDFTTVEDVAAMVSFLASEEARNITGTRMIVDGGLINCESYRNRAPLPASGSSAGSTPSINDEPCATRKISYV